jgi:hypothetical protein
VGSLTLMGGYGVLTGDDPPSGRGGFQVGLWMWGNNLFTFGAEYGRHFLGYIDRSYGSREWRHRQDAGRLTGQIQFWTPGRKIRIYSTGGVGLYGGTADYQAGINAGVGVSYPIIRLSVLGEFRYHEMLESNYEFITFMFGVDLPW